MNTALDKNFLCDTVFPEVGKRIPDLFEGMSGETCKMELLIPGQNCDGDYIGQAAGVNHCNRSNHIKSTKKTAIVPEIVILREAYRNDWEKIRKNIERLKESKKSYDKVVNGEFYICGSGGAPTKPVTNVASQG